MVDIVKEESSRQSIPLGYSKRNDPVLGDYFAPIVEAVLGGGGAGTEQIDREIVLSQYRVKTAFTDAAVGDVVSAIRVLDLKTNPASQVGSTAWYNETQQKALTAPSAANLEPLATGGLTNAQFMAAIVGLATAAKQDTGNTALNNIDGKVPAPVGGRLPVDLPGGLATSAGQVTAAQLLDAIGQLLTAINNKTPAAGTAQPVSGTFWQATQPVSGPLTDAQLRAAAVAVAGTFWQATQPVSGPLTDAQLRAAAVAVTGTFWQATQPISAAALPLPAGAATSALQTSGNTSLTTLATNLPAKGVAAGAASMPVVPASDANIARETYGSAPIQNINTSAAAGTFVSFNPQACNNLMVVNPNTVDIEFQIGGAGGFMPILAGTGYLVPGITNASQVGVRRRDARTAAQTAVEVSAQALVL